jgi:cobalt-precorrin 5A hydrolase/precorrin-3B C17-methyltransferase
LPPGTWLTDSRIPFANDGTVTLTITDRPKNPASLELVYHPKTLVLGMGCERGAATQEAIALAEQAMSDSGFSRKNLAAVVSIDLKADETAIHAVAAHFGVPARFFDAATLEAETPRLKNPSEIVFAEVGCHGVAEGAALAAVGADGALAFAKIKSKGVTVAIGRTPVIVDPDTLGRGRGKLFVVGIGPGAAQWRSPEVSAMVASSTDLVGYSLYLDLLEGLAAGKVRHDFDLGKEEARVVHAMELAGQGKTVSLVCSGDAGIYAMATLVFELFEKGGISDAASRIEVQVSPGISALQAAAARIGAPLGHDFCTISLSDLLTPWEHIQRRVKAAGEGDFVIAFYNPVSLKRRTQLAYARDRLLEYRPFDTPVVLATNLGRDGEHVRVVPLGALNVDDVDMLTVVVVGSSESRTVKTGDGKSWVYTPRGYSGKAGTGMAALERLA